MLVTRVYCLRTNDVPVTQMDKRTYGQANERTIEGKFGMTSDPMTVDLALSLCVCYIQHVWCHCEKLFSLDATECNRYSLSLCICYMRGRSVLS